MNLPDFLRHDGLNSLRNRMNADLLPWESNPSWVDLDLTSLRTDGIEIDGISSSELEFADDNTLEYREKRVILYIRDQYSHFRYKYHISNCEKLIEMDRDNRGHRYKVTDRRDGLFLVNTIDGEQGTEISLRVCRYCLGEINWRNYRTTRGASRNEIYNNFSLDDFFESFSPSITPSMEQSDHTQPVNDYPGNWPQLSESYKDRIGWQCEECGYLCYSSELKKYLHVHHINGLRYENYDENLTALCIACHALRPGHESLVDRPEYQEFGDLRNLESQIG